MKRNRRRQAPKASNAYSAYDAYTAVECEIHIELGVRYARSCKRDDDGAISEEYLRSVIDNITEAEMKQVAHSVSHRMQLGYPELAETFTLDVLEALVVKARVSHRLYSYLSDRSSTPQKALKKLWVANEDRPVNPAVTPEEWKFVVVKGVEYLLYCLAMSEVDKTRGVSGVRAAQLEGVIRPMLKALDREGIMKGYFDSRFLATMCAVVVKIREGEEEALPEADYLDDAPQKPSSAAQPTDEVTYHIPANYWAWRHLKAHLEAMSDKTVVRELGKLSQARMEKFAVSGKNFYLVGTQFLEEMEDTKMSLEGIKILEEAPLPHDAFLLVFPLGYLNVCVADGSMQEIKALHVGLAEVEGRKALFFGAIYTIDNAVHIFSTTLGFREDGTLIDSPEELEVAPENAKGFAANVLPALVSTTLTLGTLVTKILASMAAEPRIIETETVESVRKAKKQRPQLTFLYPKVIGWKVRYVRCGGGHHRTPGGPVAPHWRGRHIRRVPYGPISVPLHERPRRVVVVARTRVNSEYEKENDAH